MPFTSVDLQNWERGEPLREKVASLGLDRRSDGQLWLSFLDHRGEAGWRERLLGPPVAGMIWDGGWEETQWQVRDPEAPALVDPQWLGDRLFYVAFSGTGDPAEGITRIRSSDGVTWLEGKGLADPMPVEREGQIELFVTHHPGAIVHYAGDPLVEVHRFDATVPHALLVEDEVWLVAQRGQRRSPHRSVFRGGTWSPWEELVDAPGCTSPVLGPMREQGWVLLCVEETPPEIGRASCRERV